jgi:hypothetical protein
MSLFVRASFQRHNPRRGCELRPLEISQNPSKLRQSCGHISERGFMTPGKRAIVVVGVFGVLAAVIYILVHRSMPPTPVANAPSATKPAEQIDEPSYAQPVIEFKDRSTMQLLSVWDATNSRVSWTLDGAPLPGPTTRTSGRDTASTKPSERVLLIHYHAHADSAMKFRWFYFDAPIMATAYRWSVGSPKDGEGVMRVVVPAEMQSGDIKVGEALGGWFPQVQADVKLAPTTNVTLRPVNNVEPAATTQKAHFSFGEVFYENDALMVTMLDARTPKELLTTNWEVAVLTNDGKRVRVDGWQSSTGKFVQEFTVPRDKITGLAYQTRKIEWHTVPNVAFFPRPSASTQPVPQL